MWVDELCPDGAKNLILTILDHRQFTSIVDDTYLAHHMTTTSFTKVRNVSAAGLMISVFITAPKYCSVVFDSQTAQGYKNYEFRFENLNNIHTFSLSKMYFSCPPVACHGT